MCPIEKIPADVAPIEIGYPTPIDAIVLAGTDHNPKRLITGKNKAFLEVGGQILVQRVVESLLGASSIGRVYLVGPAERLQQVFTQPQPDLTIVEQAGNMLSNCWAAIRVCESHNSSAVDDSTPERPILFISCDLPLISPGAVDDFVTRCAREDVASARPYSMLVGVAEEASVTTFYPEDGQPGIIRPYVHLSSGRLRLANIYVCRPHSLSHQEFLQTGFSLRKAKDWRNVVRLAWSFFGRSGGWYAAWLTLRLQVTLMAARRNSKLYLWLRQGNTLDKIEQSCGNILGGSVRIVVTPYGGLSLDVDDDEDYRVLDQRYSSWSGRDPTTAN